MEQGRGPGGAIRLVSWTAFRSLHKRIKSLCGAKPPQKLRWTKREVLVAGQKPSHILEDRLKNCFQRCDICPQIVHFSNQFDDIVLQRRFRNEGPSGSCMPVVAAVIEPCVGPLLESLAAAVRRGDITYTEH